jgi:imidazolonepropionase-like amidohydrolase
MHRLFLLLFFIVMASSPTLAQDAKTTPQVLFTNVHVFDGVNEKRIENANILIEGNVIKKVSTDLIEAEGATVIDAKGKTLMPGMIDNHWHSLFALLPLTTMIQSDVAYLNFYGAKANRDALLRGFTTVRDVGGNVFGLKKATDEGLLVGPRIYPSGAYISQTSGHGDFRGPNDIPENPGTPLDYFQRTGQTLIADGVPEVIKRTREDLRMGASQIKVMAGGGVSSLYDPLDTKQYTLDELKAIVEVAGTWNTYVTVHAIDDGAVRHAIEAGVQCIEHGHLASEDTIKLMAEKGVWLSMQPLLNDEDAIPFAEGSDSQAKFEQATAGTDKVYPLAKKYGVKLAWGTDTLFDPELAKKQGKMVTKMMRWFTPFETLKMVTHDNAQLLKLSGPRDPYPGELGVVKEGALADLILVDGNPLENIQLVANPEKSFVVIMKDGKIYKNTIN